MSPAALAGILVGGLFAGAIAIAFWVDHRNAQEAKAARRAKAYYIDHP